MADPKPNTEPTTTAPVATLTCTHFLVPSDAGFETEVPMWVTNSGQVVFGGATPPDPTRKYELLPASGFDVAEANSVIMASILPKKGDK